MTVRKAASKSEARRVSAQKGTDTGAKAPVESTNVKLGALVARIEALEAKVKVLAEAPQFIADEARPIYGLGGIALIFDAIAKKLK